MKSVEYTVSSIAHDFGGMVRSTTTNLVASLIFHDSWLHSSLMTFLVNQWCKWGSSFSGTQVSSQILSLVSVLHRIMAWFSLQFTSKYMWEKAMAPHSSTLAWKIPWTEEPGRLQSMGSLIVGHDWATSLSLFTFMHWRRKWQPTPVFLLGESQGWGSLVGCHLWGHTELDTTKAT